MPNKLNRYQALIQKVFFDHFTDKTTEFEFLREELEDAATALDFVGVKNLGDIPYSFRYRNPLPASILATQPDGREWIIEGAGKGRMLSHRKNLGGYQGGRISVRWPRRPRGSLSLSRR